MWALKPPRHPAKKNINQETPERTPPEPDAAPEQALPPQSTWNWSEATDVVDSLLSLGGAYTETRRAERLLAYYAQDISKEAARWRGAREAFEREAGQVEAAAAQQQAQLRRWGLRRLRRPFAELAAARAARARAQAAAASAAENALLARGDEAAALLEGDSCRAVLEAGFCQLAPRDVLAKSATLKARRSGLRARDEAVERAAAAARSLRSRVAARTPQARVQALRRAAAAAAEADAVLRDPRADTSSRRNAAAARTAAEADADEILEDERHREGRLLAKWRARVKDQDVAPRAVLAFANRFAEDVCDAFSGKEHRSSLASLAARLCTRGGRDFLIPQRRRRALAASDRRFLACQRRFCQRLSDCTPEEVARLVGATPPPCYDAHPMQPLRVLDDLGQPPARLVEAVFEAFARITHSSNVMGAEDVLGLAVHALATSDGPMRPSTGLYVARVYGVRDPALCESGRDAEAKYLLTTLEAAVAAVAALGASEDATSTTEPETEPEVDDAISTEVDFAALAAEADADAYEGDDASLRELGRWLSTESAREDTVDLLRDEGWVR